MTGASRVGALLVGLLFGSVDSSAAVVSHGSLTSNDDGSTQIIADSLNNLHWLRWNGPQLGLTYAQTVAAIGPGGSLEGWQIARNAEAQLFVEALLSGSSNACLASGADSCNSTLPTNLTGLLGDSYADQYDDFVWFLSDNDVGAEVGSIYYYDQTAFLFKENEATTIADADNYSSSGTYPQLSIGWLLFRPATSVLEPGQLVLLGLGVLGLCLSRRRTN
jgi:hypothetical protein